MHDRRRPVLMIAFAAVLLLSSGCSSLWKQPALPPPPAPPPAPVGPPQAHEEAPTGEKKLQQVGEASWYGPQHQGKATASGEPFDQNQLTAAHPTLPLGATATVTNLATGKSVQVTINDRGPYVKGRQIDLSRAAAKKIGVTKQGVAKVKITAVVPSRTRRARLRRATAHARRPGARPPATQVSQHQ
jgi:rare lipoprotein A